MTWSDGLVAAVDGSGLIKMNEPLAVVERKPEEGLSRMAFWGKQRSASRVRWEVSLPKATATVECVRPPYRTPDGTSWTFFFSRGGVSRGPPRGHAGGSRPWSGWSLGPEEALPDWAGSHSESVARAADAAPCVCVVGWYGSAAQQGHVASRELRGRFRCGPRILAYTSQVY